MRTWIIGSTSDYSKAVADRCVGVTKFGRSNIDYDSSFDRFIKKQKYAPNWIFINLGVEEALSIATDSPDGDYRGMLNDFSKTWLWKLRLYSWLYKSKIRCTVCDVTSTITMWPQDHRENMSYAILRAIGQQTAMAHNTSKLKIFQVSPNGLTPERVDEYADKTVSWMGDPDYAVNSIVDLSNDSLVGKRRFRIEWADE